MNILTFDIEEWFHTQFDTNLNTEQVWGIYESRIERNMDLIFESLDNKKQKASFFCLGWIARKYPHIIKKIDSLGFEIGSHSDMHRLAYMQTPKQYEEDFKKAIESIENLIGKKVRMYRSPAFSIKEENKWAFETIIKNGIEIDCSIFPADRDFGGFRSFDTFSPCVVDYKGSKIKEFPMNTYNILGKDFVFSGGGYFRFFPLWAFNHMMKKSEYVMTYFHPRDFDPYQPMISGLTIERKFKSYYGLRGSIKKFNAVLNNFDFIDISEAEKLIDWNSVKTIKV